jgi:hypothetical protein
MKGTELERRKIKEFIIHLYMEMSQENSLYSYFKQTTFLLFLFLYIKSENERAEQVFSERLVPVEGRRVWGKCVGG